MKFSIIIPTLNEAKYLPFLLDSIKVQSCTDYEVIVADAGSKDETRSIALSYNARVVDGGMPAVGRNAGARNAQGEFFIFLDADVTIPPLFLENVFAEMEERFLDLATCEIFPQSDLHIDKVLHSFANLYIRMSQYSSPHAPGFCIFVSKRLFNRVQGFDETLTMAEDHEFVKRAARFRNLRILESTSILVSVRRLEKEGRAALASKYLQIELYRMFKGEPRTGVIDYEFGNFDAINEERLNKRIEPFEKQLLRISEKFTAFTKKYRTLNDKLSDEHQKQMEWFKENFESMKEKFKKMIEE